MKEQTHHATSNNCGAFLSLLLCLPHTQQDVTTFLAWAASPEMDERKLMGIKGLTILGVMWCFAIYSKRLR